MKSFPTNRKKPTPNTQFNTRKKIDTPAFYKNTPKRLFLAL